MTKIIYWARINDKNYKFSELANLLSNRLVNENTLIWTKGGDWAPIKLSPYYEQYKKIKKEENKKRLLIKNIILIILLVFALLKTMMWISSILEQL